MLRAMPATVPSVVFSISDATRRRDRVEEVRQRARALFDSGAPGIQVTTTLCSMVEKLVLEFWDEVLQKYSTADRKTIENQGVLLAVGGTGRVDFAPYSDLDLLVLDADRKGANSVLFRTAAAELVTHFWDAKL